MNIFHKLALLQALEDASQPEAYVNPGPDKRADGLLGMFFSRIQEDSAFKSPTPPKRTITGSEDEGWLREVSYSQPRDLPFIGLAQKNSAGKWDTLRVGWRWDPNWGDSGLKPGSYNPDPEIIGGYFFDVILKLGQARPHITR